MKREFNLTPMARLLHSLFNLKLTMILPDTDTESVLTHLFGARLRGTAKTQTRFILISD